MNNHKSIHWGSHSGKQSNTSQINTCTPSQKFHSLIYIKNYHQNPSLEHVRFIKALFMEKRKKGIKGKGETDGDRRRDGYR